MLNCVEYLVFNFSFIRNEISNRSSGEPKFVKIFVTCYHTHYTLCTLYTPHKTILNRITIRYKTQTNKTYHTKTIRHYIRTRRRYRGRNRTNARPGDDSSRKQRPGQRGRGSFGKVRRRARLSDVQDRRSPAEHEPADEAAAGVGRRPAVSHDADTVRNWAPSAKHAVARHRSNVSPQYANPNRLTVCDVDRAAREARDTADGSSGESSQSTATHRPTVQAPSAANARSHADSAAPRRSSSRGRRRLHRVNAWPAARSTLRTPSARPVSARPFYVHSMPLATLAASYTSCGPRSHDPYMRTALAVCRPITSQQSARVPARGQCTPARGRRRSIPDSPTAANSVASTAVATAAWPGAAERFSDAHAADAAARRYSSCRSASPGFPRGRSMSPADENQNGRCLKNVFPYVCPTEKMTRSTVCT